LLFQNNNVFAVPFSFLALIFVSFLYLLLSIQELQVLPSHFLQSLLSLFPVLLFPLQAGLENFPFRTFCTGNPKTRVPVLLLLVLDRPRPAKFRFRFVPLEKALSKPFSS